MLGGFSHSYLRNERMRTTRVAKLIIKDKTSNTVIVHHPLLLGSRKADYQLSHARYYIISFS